MNCYEYESHLSEFVDGEMSSQLRREFLRHKSDCPECLELLRDFKKAVDAVHNLPEMSVSSDFNQRLYARIQEQNESNIWDIFRGFLPDIHVPRYMVATATAVIMAFAFLGYSAIQDSPANVAPGQKSVMPPPALNIQQPVVAESEVPSNTRTSTVTEPHDTNRSNPRELPRSYENQIQYVNSD